MSSASRLGDATRSTLESAGLDPAAVADLVAAVVAEDLDGGQDVTGVATVPAEQRASAQVVARAPGVLAGSPVARAVFDVVGEGRVTSTPLVDDGAATTPGLAVLHVEGPARDLLLAERSALNLLGRLSGVATATRRWVAEIEGTGAAVRDTRKTTPMLRALEKYAVRCGGGVNHRMSLADAALVKDNHVEAAGGVAEAFAAVRARFPDVPVEVEVDTLEQARTAVAAGADLLLLDNFTVADVRRAVAELGDDVRLEVSGGLTLIDAHAYAATGVDYLAVGALTHSSPALDLGLDFEPTTA